MFLKITMVRYFMRGFILALHIHCFQKTYFVHHHLTTSTTAGKFVVFIWCVHPAAWSSAHGTWQTYQLHQMQIFFFSLLLKSALASQRKEIIILHNVQMLETHDSFSFRGGSKVADLRGTAKPWRKSRITNARQVSSNIWITTLKNNFMNIAEPCSSTAAPMKYIDSLLPLQHSQNILIHFTGGPPLYVIDLMLATISCLRTSNSRMLFNQTTIPPVHSQMKQNQQIILFSPFQRQREKTHNENTTLMAFCKRKLILSSNSLYIGHRPWTTVPQ